MKADAPWLDRILERTRADLATRVRQKPAALLRPLAAAAPKPPPFEQSLRRAPPVRVIAEIKRKSPSKGLFAAELDAARVAAEYEAGGAAALSVLTDGPFFGGSLDDLRRARAGTKALPLLRKDFVVEEYQLAESRVAGASAVLLIAAVLGDKLPKFVRAARELGLEALVEVHDDDELSRALDAGAAMVGVNNRDLRTFKVDLAVTERLAPRAQKAGVLVVAESGVHSPDDARRLTAAGADALLVGESLVLSADRPAALRALTAAGPG